MKRPPEPPRTPVKPRRTTLDGITFEVDPQGDRDHCRVYECGARGRRLITDDQVAARVVQQVLGEQEIAERARQRAAAAAAASAFGVIMQERRR